MVGAVRESNLNVGGNVLESSGAWLILRGVGLIQSVDEVKRIVVGASNGVPVDVEQIADMQLGNAFRVASLVKGTHEAVGGVVVARPGVNTKAVIDAVKARLEQITPGLPAGARVVPFYDRSELIEQAVDTLRTALIEDHDHDGSDSAIRASTCRTGSDRPLLVLDLDTAREPVTATPWAEWFGEPCGGKGSVRGFSASRTTENPGETRTSSHAAKRGPAYVRRPPAISAGQAIEFGPPRGCSRFFPVQFTMSLASTDEP